MNLPELLAPAGNFSAVDAALDHGADAVYAGIGTFNLRAHAANFMPSDLPELIERVHAKTKRLYITLNIIPDDTQLAAMEKLLGTIAAKRPLPDAFIVSDPGVISLCKEIIPAVALHLSTQTAGAFNSRSLAFWKAQGISRVVLPRELTLERIRRLSDTALPETEIFIHGAMCVAVSGRCLMGAYLSGRHPNHGDCPQPCRWKYRVSALGVDGQNPEDGQILDVLEDGSGTYLFNSRDLCTLDILPALVASGVSSLKIEGRNKSAHYVAAVVKCYREALDTIGRDSAAYRVDAAWKTMLDSIEHRPYTTGFYDGSLVMQEVFSSKATSASRIVGIVKALLPGGFPVVDVKNGFTRDDPLELLPVRQYQPPSRITITGLTDLSGNPIERSPSNRLVVLHGTEHIQPGDMLRRQEVVAP